MKSSSIAREAGPSHRCRSVSQRDACAYCEEALLHRRAITSPLRTAIENAISPLLPHGKAQIDIVARELGMSRRTLAWKLTADDLTFDGIVDQLRSDLAARYLEERNLAIAQIAWLVGYGSPFTRACKRWTGATPGHIRSRLSRLI